MPLASSTPDQQYSKSYLRYALGLLVAVYTFNFIDRQILVILQESIKKEMGLSDAQLGLLSGFSFAVFYATLGIPIARMADRGVRRDVIAVAITVWSVMTALSGATRTYFQLLAARIGVAIGEAGGSPPAHAMISDYFPPRERGRALAIYSTGVYLGVLFGYLAGGWINQFFGWRVAFLVVGVPGLVVALLVRLTIREPRRGHSEGATRSDQQVSFLDGLRILWRSSTFRWLALAVGFTSFVTYGTGNFGPSFLARVHHVPSGQIGTILGLLGGFGGMAGTYLGGWLGDRFGARDARWYLWVPAIALTVAAPFRVAAYFVPDTSAIYPLLAGTELLLLTYLAPSIAVAHFLVSPSLRAFTSSILFFALSIIGLGLGPPFTGLMSDVLAPRFGAESLRWALAATSLASLPAAGCYLLAAARLRRDLPAPRNP
jgi:MFS family permease